MPVSRKRKRNPHASQKRKRIHQVRAIRHLASLIKNQQILDHCLLAEDDVMKRREMYQRLSPMLPFSGHHFPTRPLEHRESLGRKWR